VKTRLILNFVSILITFAGVIKYTITGYPELVIFMTVVGLFCLAMLADSVIKLYKEVENGKKSNS
jgi:hypothetical protein